MVMNMIVLLETTVWKKNLDLIRYSYKRHILVNNCIGRRCKTFDTYNLSTASYDKVKRKYLWMPFAHRREHLWTLCLTFERVVAAGKAPAQRARLRPVHVRQSSSKVLDHCRARFYYTNKSDRRSGIDGSVFYYWCSELWIRKLQRRTFVMSHITNTRESNDNIIVYLRYFMILQYCRFY